MASQHTPLSEPDQVLDKAPPDRDISDDPDPSDTHDLPNDRPLTDDRVKREHQILTAIDGYRFGKADLVGLVRTLNVKNTTNLPKRALKNIIMYKIVQRALSLRALVDCYRVNLDPTDETAEHNLIRRLPPTRVLLGKKGSYTWSGGDIPQFDSDGHVKPNMPSLPHLLEPQAPAAPRTPRQRARRAEKVPITKTAPSRATAPAAPESPVTATPLPETPGSTNPNTRAGQPPHAVPPTKKPRTMRNDEAGQRDEQIIHETRRAERDKAMAQARAALAGARSADSQSVVDVCDAIRKMQEYLSEAKTEDDKKFAENALNGLRRRLMEGVSGAAS